MAWDSQNVVTVHIEHICLACSIVLVEIGMSLLPVIPLVQLLAKKNFPDVTLWQRCISLEYMPLELKETVLFEFFHALCVCFSLLLLLALLYIRLVNVRQVFLDIQKLEHVKVTIWAHRATIYCAEILLRCHE